MARRKSNRKKIITAAVISLSAFGLYRMTRHAAPSAPSTPPTALASESRVTQAEKNEPALVQVKTEEYVAEPAQSTPPPAAEIQPTTKPVMFAAPLATLSPSQALSDAKQKLSAGDILGARAEVNDVLISGAFTSDEAKALKSFIAEINSSVVMGPRIFADDTFGGSHTVGPGESMAKIAVKYSTTWQLLCRINRMSDPKRLRAAQTIKVVKGPFYAVVTKSTFTMDLYLGNPGNAGSMYVTSFPVGLGKDDSTPTGEWKVEDHKKIQNPTYFSPRGEGVIAADDPKNPLGEHWIGLIGMSGHAVGKTSYGIHGTIEPESIGKMGSLGCIRMRNEDVAMVFDMMVEGKSIVVVRD